MTPRNRFLLIALCSLLWPFSDGFAQPQSAPTSAPDPFSQLKPVYTRDTLPPLRSVRPRLSREEETKRASSKILIGVETIPKGALVFYGKKKLGVTPLTVPADENRTPLDITIRYKGYMTLRSRIFRDKKRTYVFKLTPAKF